MRESTIGGMAHFGQVLEEYRPRLLAMLVRRIDPALAVRIDPEEILNEAFLKAIRKSADSAATCGQLCYSYLYRLALDCLVDAWRRETRDRRNLVRDCPFPAASSVQLGLGIVGRETSPSHHLVRAELQACMARALDALRPQDREVLWMRHYDQLSHREIADVLGITEPAATRRYIRALKRLKDLWDVLYGEQGIG